MRKDITLTTTYEEYKASSLESHPLDPSEFNLLKIKMLVDGYTNRNIDYGHDIHDAHATLKDIYNTATGKL